MVIAWCISSAAATIIDLSKDLPEDTAAMKFSEGAKAMEQAAIAEPAIRAAIVMENGKIVSSYYREDVSPSDSSPIFSAAKSWMGLLIGLLVDDGLLSVHQTLGEIFPEDEAWTDVTDGSEDFRKNVTIKEMLTMTSGLVPPSDALISFFLGTSLTSMGGSSLSDSLAYPGIGEKGKVTYLALSNILSYVILKISGKTPGNLLAERVMPHFGIQVDDYGWTKNADGLENAFIGMEVTPAMMLKFGQLYIQKGLAGPYEEQRVVSQRWVEDSFTRHAHAPFSIGRMNAVFPIFALQGETDVYFGYLFWGHSTKPNVFCLSGLGGNDMCIDPDNKRVVLQLADFDFSTSDFMGIPVINLKLVHIGLDETLSFSAPNPNTEDSASHEVIGEEMESPTSAVNALKSEELLNSGVMHVSLATFFGLSVVLCFLLL